MVIPHPDVGVVGPHRVRLWSRSPPQAGATPSSFGRNPCNSGILPSSSQMRFNLITVTGDVINEQDRSYHG